MIMCVCALAMICLSRMHKIEAYALPFCIVHSTDKKLIIHYHDICNYYLQVLSSCYVMLTAFNL